MSLRFTPKSREQIEKERSPLSDGFYDFTVAAAEDAKSGPLSKSPGTPMIKLKLIIFKDDGSKTNWNDILHPEMDYKIRGFCETAGLMKLYESGELSAVECVGASGTLQIKIKKDRMSGEMKPEVVDYGGPKAGQTATSPRAARPSGSESFESAAPASDDPFA